MLRPRSQPPVSAHSTAAASPIRPGSWAAWRVALRPKTLWIAMIPVVVAACLAWSLAGAFDAGIAAIALVASVLMQVVTNLQNDVGYTERGGETGARVGLPRATANGWLGTGAVKRAVVASIVLAQVVALPLMIRGGWPIVATSAASTLSAWAYMGGPRPIAYTPLGELTVFVFFGMVAVCGTWYVLVGALGVGPAIAGAAIGMHAAAVLLVNNFRDREHDATTGRRTLPVVLGRDASLALYACLLFAPFALVVALALHAESAWFVLPLFALPWAWRLARRLPNAPAGPAQNAMLFSTVLLEVAFGGALSAGALANGMLR
jgi:1,4-dihydroxy-2-naphthoate octaprenyltransferase